MAWDGLLTAAAGLTPAKTPTYSLISLIGDRLATYLIQLFLLSSITSSLTYLLSECSAMLYIGSTWIYALSFHPFSINPQSG